MGYIKAPLGYGITPYEEGMKAPIGFGLTPYTYRIHPVVSPSRENRILAIRPRGRVTYK